MTWNWQKKEWPNFRYESSELEQLEKEFIKNAGILIGSFCHINEKDKTDFKVELISNEAIKTSEIEGEYLNRESVQSSVRKNFGLSVDQRRISPKEKGISDIMVDVFQNFNEDLTHEILFKWHRFLAFSRYEVEKIGGYRTHSEPMQIISGPIYSPKVFFEAPPSTRVYLEMDRFIGWFNRSAPAGTSPLSTFVRAGIAHLYFESIHPFEDGNGRIGRAIAEKSLAQSAGHPSLIALAHTIQSKKKDYYSMLEHSNQSLEITDWLIYFAKTTLDAQLQSQKLVNFLILKTKFYEKFKNILNERQEKVIARLFKSGLPGFEGGLSAEKYIAITGTSRPTATRDLAELVSIGALSKTGVLKGSRYHLNFEF